MNTSPPCRTKAWSDKTAAKLPPPFAGKILTRPTPCFSASPQACSLGNMPPLMIELRRQFGRLLRAQPRHHAARRISYSGHVGEKDQECRRGKPRRRMPPFHRRSRCSTRRRRPMPAKPSPEFLPAAIALQSSTAPRNKSRPQIPGRAHEQTFFRARNVMPSPPQNPIAGMPAA